MNHETQVYIEYGPHGDEHFEQLNKLSDEIVSFLESNPGKRVTYLIENADASESIARQAERKIRNGMSVTQASMEMSANMSGLPYVLTPNEIQKFSELDFKG